jgi:hypothetical protein
LKSQNEKNFSVFLWEDPDGTDFDPQCLEQVKEILPVPGDQNVKGMIFGNLKVNVKEVLRKPAPPPPRPDPSDSFDVVIQHNDEDSPDAARIREYLRNRHNLKAQFANPTLPKSNTMRSIKRNKELYYQRAKRFVVLYGRANDEWTNDVCFAMQPHIGEHYGGLVLLTPPPESPKAKRYYLAPDDFYFTTKPCFDGKYEMAIDDWLLNQGLLNAAGSAGGG